MVVDVSRPPVASTWKDLLLAPVEFLALAWGGGVFVLLLLLPVGLAIAGLLWLARTLSGS